MANLLVYEIHALCDTVDTPHMSDIRCLDAAMSWLGSGGKRRVDIPILIQVAGTVEAAGVDQ